MSIAGIDDDEWPKSGKLTEAEANARQAVAWEHEHSAAFFAGNSYEAWSCTGPCDNGRKLCPSQQACQRAMQEFCGYTWADRFGDWFWSLQIIERAGPGTGLALIAGCIVGLVALAVVVWP